MLVSDKIGPVDSSYKPGLGEEVYDTLSKASYRGDGMTAISALTPLEANVELESSFYMGMEYFPDATLSTGPGAIPYVQMASGGPTGYDDYLISTAIKLPSHWTACNVVAQMLTASDEDTAANISFGFDFYEHDIATNTGSLIVSNAITHETPGEASTMFTISLNEEPIPVGDSDFISINAGRLGGDTADVNTKTVYMIGLLFTSSS